MKKSLIALIGIVMAVVSTQSVATNYPCSGKKGGVSHCE